MVSEQILNLNNSLCFLHKLPSIIVKNGDKLSFNEESFIKDYEISKDSISYVDLLYKHIFVIKPIINREIIEQIKNMVIIKNNVSSFIQDINTKFSLSIKSVVSNTFDKNKLINLLYKNIDKLFNITLFEYKIAINNIINECLKTDKELTVDKHIFRKLTVSYLEIGDIVYDYYNQHPVIIIDIFNENKIKYVTLSTKPNENSDNLTINSRFLPKESYIRLNVSINDSKTYLSQYIGSVNNQELESIKNFLKLNNLI